MDWRKKIDLFVFDLDGTALGGYEPYERFPDSFSIFLDELNSCGVHWCINSTWHPLKQGEMIARSAVRSLPAFAYGRTGLIRGQIGKHGIICLDYTYITRIASIQNRFERIVRQWLKKLDDNADLKKMLRTEVVPDEPCMCKLSVPIDAFDLLQAVVKQLERDLPGIYGVPDKKGTIILHPSEMSKGEAVRTIQSELGISPERTLIAGDASNDLTMLDPLYTHYMTCPANASTEVKARVLANGGTVGEQLFSDGVIEAVHVHFSNKGQIAV